MGLVLNDIIADQINYYLKVSLIDKSWIRFGALFFRNGLWLFSYDANY